MKIVFLVINYMPHQMVSIRSIIKNYNVEVHSFSFKDNIRVPVKTKDLITYRAKDFSRLDFLNKLVEIQPQIMIVAGWAVSDFVWVSKQVRKKLNIPVVSYSDTQWRNTIKQRINCLVSHWHLKKAFSHVWVAGIYQYEYARKLGFSKKHIIYNSLCCDLELFSKVSISNKQKKYPKNFLYIGRFVPVKGLNLLLEAWSRIVDKKGWSLTLVGDGPEKKKIENFSEVIVKDFMPQNQLIKEFEQAGCFILPSYFEQWSLVIHEAAASGLPIIATNICGAAPHFLVSGFNGYQVEPTVGSIKQALEKIMALDDSQLSQFSKNSRKLAESITPDLGAAQLMSILEEKEFA